MTEIFDIPAFLPTSQLSPENYPRVPEGDKSEILRNYNHLLVKKLRLRS